MPVSPDVFDYDDYRALLRDAYETRRQQRHGWSYEVWARQLGLRSPSTLVMIIKGRRNPSPRLAEAIAKWMGLDPDRASYFYDLVQLSRSRRNVRVAAMLIERLRSRHKGEGFHFVDPQEFAAISHWYYYAIREMVQLSSFQEDPQWIQSHLTFPVSLKEIREALTILEKKGLLARDEGGRLRLAPGNIEVYSEAANEAIQVFHEESLGNALLGIRRLPPVRRELRGTTFAIKPSRLSDARELIRKFQSEFCDLLEESGAEAVYHLEIAFFPVAEAGTAYVP